MSINGKMELIEKPVGVEDSRVLVTFLPEGAVNLLERGVEEASQHTPGAPKCFR